MLTLFIGRSATQTYSPRSLPFSFGVSLWLHPTQKTRSSFDLGLHGRVTSFHWIFLHTGSYTVHSLIARRLESSSYNCCNMLDEHENMAPAKCEIRLCRCLVTQKFRCSKCGKACHWECYKGLILEVKGKPPLPSLPEELICCTKKCYGMIVKDASSSQRGDWKNDGKPETPNITSIKLLLDW